MLISIKALTTNLSPQEAVAKEKERKEGVRFEEGKCICCDIDGKRNLIERKEGM